MLRNVAVFVLLCFSFSAEAQINMLVKKDGFLFMEGRDSICFYQKAPKDLNGLYGRCNYIHPLYAPDGTRLTEDFPSDHPHQRGIFWAWHQILIDGKLVSDGWELKNFSQKVRNFEFKSKNETGFITTLVDWNSPLWKNGSEAYLTENTKITIYPKSGNFRRFDFEIKLAPATDFISLGGSDDEKGYGGFSVRLILPEDVVFIGEEGEVEPQENAIRSGKFMKIEGSFTKQGARGGVVMWSHQQNPEPSGNWILRKKASIQNVSFPGRVPVAIPVAKPLELNYSLLVFQGRLSVKQVKKAMKNNTSFN